MKGIFYWYEIEGRSKKKKISYSFLKSLSSNIFTNKLSYLYNFRVNIIQTLMIKDVMVFKITTENMKLS